METLLAIAEHHRVSLDWLLGLSQHEGLVGALLPSMEIEASEDDDANLLVKWHAKARDFKIRYVSSRLSDLLRTPEVIAYEAAGAHQSAAVQADGAAFRLDYNRAPGTDMESCMPLQTLEGFAAGEGVWGDLPRLQRRAQLLHIAELIDELYPSSACSCSTGGNGFLCHTRCSDRSAPRCSWARCIWCCTPPRRSG